MRQLWWFHSSFSYFFFFFLYTHTRAGVFFVSLKRCVHICSWIISADRPELSHSIDVTPCRPMGSSGRRSVGKPEYTLSDLSFDKQHLRMQRRLINLDNVNICVEILIRDDLPPMRRGSLKNIIPWASSRQKKIIRGCLCWGWPAELKINNKKKKSNVSLNELQWFMSKSWIQKHLLYILYYVYLFF